MTTPEELAARERYMAAQRMAYENAKAPTMARRIEYLEADNAAQRTAILKLERQVRHLRIAGTVIAAVAGWLFGRAFT